ncbi:DUF3316 domain-containing protein [Vibrio sp. ER1A]|uniref:DUF3316 domain-containing protein n=1 Tax=Vibrio sp. ER1A TaxID=1517681 RepID=UPI0004DD8858|nr:DUF3316 domain-containing protein [Vibrio sp. ER1A]KFB00039.1 hypothetical protein HW45_00295 [Vibrio sp. ER1A]
MKKLLSLAAVLAAVPMVSFAQYDNIYGNGGIETAPFASKAEAMAAAEQAEQGLEGMPSHELVYVLRTPHKELKHNSLKIVKTEVKTREKDGMYTGFVDVEYRFSRYD